MYASCVGTVTTAVQISTEIPRVSGRLDVYQRTPIWVFPKLDYPTSRAVKWLFARRPTIQDAVRRSLTRLLEAGLVQGVIHYESSAPIIHGRGWVPSELWYGAARGP